MIKKPKVNWMIQENIFEEENYNSFVNAIKNHPDTEKLIEVKYVPFGSGEYNYFNDEECVVCLGTINFITQIKREYPWIPGYFANFSNYNCHIYYNYFYDFLLNKDYIILPLGNMIQRKEWLFKTFGINGNIFIRPSSGIKSFTGFVINEKDYESHINYFLERNNVSHLICVSSPKKINEEYRFVVAKNTNNDLEIVSGSQYKNNNSLCISKDINKETFENVEIIVNSISQKNWVPDDIFIMDICKHNGEYSILEINSLSCSGLYYCDSKLVVDKIVELSQREWIEINSI